MFQAIDEERSVINKKGRSTEDKLLTLAEALRTIVEHGVKVFRRKRSAPALVAHIVQILSISDVQISEPLTRLYGRILRAFLSHRPHIDHLSEEEWRELVSSCILGLAYKGSPDYSDDEKDTQQSFVQSSEKKKQLSRSGTPATLSISFRSNGKSRTTTQDIAGNQSVEDFCACLALLLSATHQPILSVSDTILEAVFQFFDTASQNRNLQTQEHAFSILNHLLRFASLEALDVAFRIVTQGLPYVRELWHFKAHTGLKDQMLILLLRSRSMFPKLMKDIESFSADLQQLSDTLFVEYSKRREFDILQLDDLIFGFLDSTSPGPPLANHVIQLHTGFPRSEQAWVTLSTLATIAVLRVAHSSVNMVPGSNRLLHTPKRRKTEHPFLDMLKGLENGDRSERLTILQVTTFIAAESQLGEKYCAILIEAVIPTIIGEDSHIANWAIMVATWQVEIRNQIIF